MADDKKGLAVLLGLGKGKGDAAGDGSDDVPDDSADGDLEAIAGDVLDALEAKDPAAFAAALKDFVSSVR